MSYRIYLSPPSQNGTEETALKDCLASNWLAPVGPALDDFEASLNSFFPGKSILAVNSGTSAIHLALILSGVSAGDEVLVASHTHNATVNPIIYQGAIPVFIDAEKETWNISPYFLEHAIEDRIKKGSHPKALVLVHLYGMPAQLDSILEICQKYEITVIEDAAEALGSQYKGKALGSFGQFGILSFNGNKIVSSGGGGALICPSEQSREKALFYATQARDDAPHFQHSDIGYNYRLSNVLAALGNAQLNDLQVRVEKRRNVFEQYKAAFSALNETLNYPVVSWVNEQPEAFSNRWLSTFLVKPHNSITHDSWRYALENAGIESRPLWKPMHLQPVFENHLFFGDNTSDGIFEQGICLPSGSELTSLQIEEITSVISALYK